MNATELEQNERADIRQRLEMVLEKTKEACGRLEEKAAAAAKTADKTVRNHPYQAMGIAFGVGLLVGVLAMRNRRD